jgi:hypothetical protein
MSGSRSRTPRVRIVPEKAPDAVIEPETIDEVVDGEIVDEDIMSTDVVVFGTIVEDTDEGGNKKRKFVFTPYQAHSAVNAMLVAAGVDKKIPPQMMYTYRSQERFASKVGTDGRYEVDTDSFIEWATGYVAKAARLAEAKTKAAAA